MIPRTLTVDDVPQCLELSSEAGWNQTNRDWIRLLTLSPDGCFGLDSDGRLAATATVACYGTALAWIGMVIVRRVCRGRGLARILLRHALDYAAGKGIACVKLDATDLGEPVYRKLGFQPEIGVERWVREPAPLAAPLPALDDGTLDLALDRQTFGADRSTLLWLLELEGCLATADGSYAMERPGARAVFLGPSVTRQSHGGAPLFTHLLAGHAGRTVFWDRFSANAAVEPDLGFQRARSLLRMYKGERLDGDPSRQFALAGFELG